MVMSPPKTRQTRKRKLQSDGHAGVDKADDERVHRRRKGRGGDQEQEGVRVSTNNNSNGHQNNNGSCGATSTTTSARASVPANASQPRRNGNGNVHISSSAENENAPAVSSTATAKPTSRPKPDAPGRYSSSVSLQLRRLAQDSMQRSTASGLDAICRGKEEDLVAEERGDSFSTKNDTPTTFCDTTSEVDDFNIYENSTALGRERRKLKFILYTTFTFIIMILLAASAIIYTQHVNHCISDLKRNAIDFEAGKQQSEAIRRQVQNHKHTRIILLGVHSLLDESRQEAAQLKEELARIIIAHETQIQEYKSIFQQHDEELRDAIVRINTLRGDKEESEDYAWLRIDELMEENSEISSERKRVQLRDKELIRTIESLTLRLQTANRLYEDLNGRHTVLTTKHDLLQYNHNQLSDLLLAPLLTYAQNIQLASERQHGVIMEMTSLVHSLHSSLEISRENLQTTTMESMNALDAVVVVTNEAAYEREHAYEMEREHYMQHMEFTLERLEDEAMGAVQAVAEAAGKLEYERKVEEEGRWHSYVEEAETILSSIQEDHDDNNLVEGLGETSVLRAAMTRRIEEGISSLRSYIHPYNYVKAKEAISRQEEED